MSTIPFARRLAVLLALLAAAAPAGAQAFAVVSSQPADHAVSVPLQTTLALTFSAPVATASVPTLAVFPTAAATLGAPARSADGRTVSFPLALQADTRYVVLVVGAEAADGRGLAVPFALNLTTGATNGPITIRGTVTGAGGLVPDGAIVALVTGDVATGNVQIIAADVVEGAAAGLPYALGPVPFSVYTAGAVRLPLPLGSATAGAGYGLYDPDGDGTPNPIFGTTGINITLAPPPPRTAREDIDGTVAAAADALGETPRLVAVEPAVVDAGGAAAAWSYRFDGADTGAETRIVRLGAFTLPAAVATPTPGEPPLPTVFIDSPDVVRIAEQNGGSAFRAAHAGQTVTVTLRSFTRPSGEAFWRAEYRASGGDAFDFETLFIVLAAGEPAPGAAPVRLALRSANPARGAVAVSLSVDAPGPVRVSVLDARGRLVARLLDGPLAAGEAALRWEPAAGLAAGLYRVVAEAGGRTASVAVTRVR
ncbi:MAG TPA: Ig-like domain-containing protein [Rubricoccaceae bacterium]|jgi:methionine-rich copper-binding protein CopC